MGTLVSGSVVEMGYAEETPSPYLFIIVADVLQFLIRAA
jgi:hypothetical protein